MKTLAALLLASVVPWLVSSAAPQWPLHAAAGSGSETAELLSLHKALVERASLSGNEDVAGSFLADYLRAHNLSIETQQVAPGRHNILAYVGPFRDTRVLLSSHIDVVPPFWPYERRGGEIWGRGTVDAKGCVAAMVIAVLDLLRAREVRDRDVALLFVVGEETFGDGMRAANGLGLAWESVIFGEPTGLKLASGHKGILGVRIAARGRAGHSGYPELGRNANLMLVRALSALDGLALPASAKYGNTTLNIGMMHGGVAANVIAEDATANIAIRIADGTPEDVGALILSALQKTGVELHVSFMAGYGPVPIDHDIEGFETIVVNYGTDIPHLQGRHKRYLYGPGDILVAHSDHEHLTVSDLEAAVEGYKTLIRGVLQK